MSVNDPELDPARASTRTPMRVRFVETDLMGIVHHASYFTYFEHGRVEWLRARAVTYADWANKGIHLPVVEAHAEYKSPARFDDELVVETTLAELRTVSLKFTYRIERAGTLVATGHTRLACIDGANKLHRMTGDMRAVLLAGEVSPRRP